jgi:regulator of sigma E protease
MPIIESVKDSPDAPLNLVIKRDGETKNITVKPVKPLKPADRAPAIGVMFETHVDDVADVLLRPTPGKLVMDAATIMVRTVKGLVTPGSSISFQHLSGPLRIGSIYYRLFEMPEGWRLVLWFSVLLNVNLAILNMLPFPVLDGGHITMALLGLVRKKPVLHVRVLEFIQTGCALLLIGFMLYVTWFDSIDLFGGKSKDAAQQTMEFAPPAK